jgi:hypothetical protein
MHLLASCKATLPSHEGDQDTFAMITALRRRRRSDVISPSSELGILSEAAAGLLVVTLAAV